MCGIIGYIGEKQAAPVLYEGLKKLEYRGYDSSGVTVLNGGRLFTVKAKGRLTELQRLLPALPEATVGIGHTRWATHGEPSELNSHPHLSTDGNFAIVHNGIIENYDELKNFLSCRGFKIISETDSEIIAHLIEYYFQGDILCALKKTALRLKGAFALAIISAFGNEIYALKKDSPLIIGVGKGENFIASDVTAISRNSKEYIILDDCEIGIIGSDKVEIYNLSGELIEKPHFLIQTDENEAQKKGFPHFMLKEIFEQPEAIKKTVDAYPSPISLPTNFCLKSVVLCACGSAYHAAFYSSTLFTRLLKAPVSTVYASEFRYFSPLIDENTLFIAVSQSGETADTLFSLRLAKSMGALTAAIVNVENSSIDREAEISVRTKAGPEIAVATTKGFTSQVAALTLLAYSVAAAEQIISDSEYLSVRNVIYSAAETLKGLLGDLKPYQKTSNEIYSAQNVFFIGRREDYALAKEGALKLKEISYIHAESYPAGELKHGTISLIEKGSICFAISTQDDLKEKIQSNIKEIRARGGVVYVITPFTDFFSSDATVIPVPNCGSEYCAVTAMQLISYYTASLRGCDIDKPRNLAKSVTVE